MDAAFVSESSPRATVLSCGWQLWRATWGGLLHATQAADASARGVTIATSASPLGCDARTSGIWYIGFAAAFVGKSFWKGASPSINIVGHFSLVLGVLTCSPAMTLVPSGWIVSNVLIAAGDFKFLGSFVRPTPLRHSLILRFRQTGS